MQHSVELEPHDLSDIYSNPMFYVMTVFNVAFMVTLIVAGVLLWRLNRRGLRMVVYTLLAEVTYLIGVATVSIIPTMQTLRSGMASLRWWA